MGLFPESKGDLVFPPKMGEKKTFSLIGDVKRVESTNKKFNYRDKDEKDCGYYDLVPVFAEVTDKEGKTEEKETNMLLGTWKLYFALKESDVDVGDTIEIDHAGVGEYIIKKV